MPNNTHLINKEHEQKVIFTIKTLNDRDFYISQCPSCDYYLDANQQFNYCPNCGQKLDWSED